MSIQRFSFSSQKRSDEDTSTNRQTVFKNRDSQIRRIAAEPLSCVITGKGSCDSSHAAETVPSPRAGSGTP